MADIKQRLDLDILLPEPHEVKLGGEYHEVRPIKLKQFIKLLKLFGSFTKLQASKDISAVEQIGQLGKEIEETLDPLIPALKEKNLDLTFEQLGALMEFVMSVSSDMDKKALETEGIKITEKKRPVVQESSKGSPTSSEHSKATH